MIMLLIPVQIISIEVFEYMVRCWVVERFLDTIHPHPICKEPHITPTSGNIEKF